MAIPNTARRSIRPTHRGEMLRQDFMPDYDLTVSGLAKAIGVSRQTINELLRAQRAVDLWDAAQASKTEVGGILS